MSRLRDLARLRLARPDARTLLEAYSGGRRRTWWLYRLAGLFA